MEKRDRRTIGVGRITRHRSRLLTGALKRGVGPVRGGPGKLGYSWILRTKVLLLEVTLQLQTERVSTGFVLRQEWLESRRSRGRVHGHTQARLRVGRIEHKVLKCTVVVAVVLMGSQGLLGRGRGKP